LFFKFTKIQIPFIRQIQATLLVYTIYLRLVFVGPLCLTMTTDHTCRPRISEAGDQPLQTSHLRFLSHSLFFALPVSLSLTFALTLSAIYLSIHPVLLLSRHSSFLILFTYYCYCIYRLRKTK
jgi:hypothetical protein